MKTAAQLDREIHAVADFVNSFPKYDPANAAQARGFLVLNALEWARGRLHKQRPSEALKKAGAGGAAD